MRFDDIIILGRTTPVKTKKYGYCVCTAGYSQELRQFIRIFPIPIKCKIKTLCKISVEVERSKSDSRFESWALKSRSEDSILSVSDPIDKGELLPILRANVSESISELNRRKVSLGVLRPQEFEIYLEERKKPEHYNFGVRTMESFPLIPRMRLKPVEKRDQGRFMLTEWGVYELMRAYERKGKLLTATDIINALHISNRKETYFVVGNINKARNTFVVIKAFTYLADSEAEYQIAKTG